MKKVTYTITGVNEAIRLANQLNDALSNIKITTSDKENIKK